MCISCYAFSLMTLVSPVNEAPQPVNIPALSPPAAYQDQQKQFTPDQVRASVASVLKRLPATSKAQLLRDAFNRMQSQLVGVNDQGQAYEIVNTQMQLLSDQVLAAPNPVELLQILQEVERIVPQPQASRLLLNSNGSQWGWLS